MAYPLQHSQPYPRNQWWVAALSSEVGDTILDRTILGAPVVLYRTSEGTAVALHGLCPHRLYPLARGTRTGDQTQCGYHGFVFGADGRCTHVPTQERIPSNFAVKAYPVVERPPFVWIWTGQPERADTERIPDATAGGIDVPGWRVWFTRRMHLKARYTLLTDNLMDLSHLAFIHRATVGEGAGSVLVEATVEETATSYRVERSAKGVPNVGFTKMLFPEYDGNVEIVTTSEYLGPAMIPTAAPHVYAAATATEPRRMLGGATFTHVITPETATTTHYFNAGARNFRTDDAQLDHMWEAINAQILGEDAEALECIERSVDEFADLRREISVRSDAGALHVRHLLDAQIERETALALA